MNSIPSKSSEQHAPLALRVVGGAGLGALVGVVLIGVGLIRGLLFLMGGGSMQALSMKDLLMFVYYVGGFALGGAVFGALRPFLPGRLGIYVGCMIVGIIVMLAIAISDRGSIGALERWDLLVSFTTGPIFGAAAAFGWTWAMGSVKRGR